MLDNMPQSPFLPGTKVQFAWDSTSLGYIKTCPRLYQYTIIEGWQPKEESIHLRFGGEYHAAIQDYEMLRASGVPREAAIRETIRQLLIRIQDWDPDPLAKAFAHKNKSQLLYLVVAYFDEFRDDPCETVILENGKPGVELSFRFNVDWAPQSNPEQPYILCGHLDRVVKWNDEVFVIDHKTTTTLPTDYYFAQYAPNNQMTLYTFAGKVIFESLVRGVIIEAVQVTNEKPMKFERRPTYRNDEVIDEWLSDLEVWLLAAEDYARAEYWPQNDTACDKFGGCRFREICSKSPRVREQFLKSNFVQLPEEERWNPLRAR